MREVNICTFCVVDRLRLTIKITFSISSYINVNLLYLIRNNIFIKDNSGELGTPRSSRTD